LEVDWNVDSYQVAQQKLERIEAELIALGWWRDEPLPHEMMEFRAPFAMDTMPFAYWLQFVFIPSVRAIIARRGSFPQSSHVGAQAVREFDGVDKANNLIARLIDFDSFVSGLRS
jgi:uncharacterized protein YqcC (DUF446 family)